MKSAEPIQEPMVPRYQLTSLRHVLEERERELLVIKGHCSNKHCRLHYAHSGPCDEPRLRL